MMGVTLTRTAQSGVVKTFFRADNGRTARRTPIGSVPPPGMDRCTMHGGNSEAVAQRGHFEYMSGELTFPEGSDTLEQMVHVRVCPGICVPPEGLVFNFELLSAEGATITGGNMGCHHTSSQACVQGLIRPHPNQPTPCENGWRTSGGPEDDGDSDGDGDDDGGGGDDGDGDDDGDGGDGDDADDDADGGGGDDDDGDADGDDDDGDDDGDGDGDGGDDDDDDDGDDNDGDGDDDDGDDDDDDGDDDGDDDDGDDDDGDDDDDRDDDDDGDDDDDDGDDDDGDDDDGPDEEPEISISDTRDSEAAGVLAFPVALSAESGESVTVEWATSAGTATPGPGRDYTEATGTLTFMAGQTARTLHVTVRDDKVKEDDETVTVTLSNPANASIASGKETATGTIVDDDGSPRILVSDATASEEEGELNFAITLEGRSDRSLSVEWTTSAGTARPGEDYVESSGTLIIGPAANRGEITVTLLDDTIPEEDESLTLTLSQPLNARINGRTISATGTIRDNDQVRGPLPEIRITDSAAAESAGQLVFAATLNRAAGMPATVRWATSAGTATAGLDYVESGGTLTFSPGQTSANIAVTLLDDLLYEGPETFRVTLSEPSNATIATAGATGVIRDDDGPELSEAWLARFSRTAASHALEAVEERMTRPTGQGSQITIAGHRLDLSSREARIARNPRADPATGTDPGYILQYSSFRFSGFQGDGDETDAGSHDWSIWGRGAATRFGGAESNLTVDGDISTGTVGIDFERGRVMFGIAASHTYGEGDVLEHGAGRRIARDTEMESTLTTGLPYLRIALGESMSIWGVLGHGRGTMTLSQEGLGSIGTDIAMDMGALGFRRELKKNTSKCRCLDLAIKSDVLVLNATSDQVVALPALSRDVSRARLMMEGSRTRSFESGALLVPTAELGLRHDGGDAETGTGMEFGAGLRYANPPRGLQVELKGRSLLTHQSGELTEWGVSGTLRIDPVSSRQGLSFNLRSSFGNAFGGIGRLWEQQQGQAFPGYGPTRIHSVTEADLGYRLDVLSNRANLMPYIGAGLSDQSGHAFRLGARFRLWDALNLDFEGVHRDGIGPLRSGFVLGLRGSFHW